MKVTMGHSAVLFDLDNTLVDRAHSVILLAKRFANRYATRLPSVTPEMVVATFVSADGDGYRTKGETLTDLLAVLPWKNAPRLNEFEQFWREELPRCLKGMPRVKATLRTLSLRGFLLGIVTNGSSAMQNAKIDTLGLRHYMSSIVISEEVGVRKPDRRIFEKALAGMGTAPNDTWFVGDHPTNDIVAATQAGLHAIWLRGSHSWPEEYPRLAKEVDSLDEILKTIP